ncbi:MAG: hypothetical protein FWC21_06005 [Treponema sp.]|nr:hypothetical protein [Treponema sp.]
MTAEEIVSQMILEEKTSLCSGKDLWMLKSVDRLGLSSIMVADGPHGLRKQIIKHVNLGAFESVPATCFPTAAATACSFDRDLLYSIGQVIGEECLQENVAVVLGPGINIKRSPLCGRNFEYISEDPYISGEIAAALINGAQSKGVGTSSRDIRLKSEINVSGDGFETLLADQKNKSPEYFNLAVKELVISDSSFEALYGQKLPPKERRIDNYDVNCTLTEIAHTEPGRKLAAKITEHMAVMFGGSRDGFRLMMESMMMDLPLRSLAMVSGGLFNLNMAEAFVDILNGKPCANPELEKMF